MQGDAVDGGEQGRGRRRRLGGVEVAFGRERVQPSVQAVIGDPMPVFEESAGDRCLFGSEGVQVHGEPEFELDLASFVSGQELGAALKEALTGVDRRIGDGEIADHGVDGPQRDRLVEF